MIEMNDNNSCTCLKHQQQYPQDGYCIYCGKIVEGTRPVVVPVSPVIPYYPYYPDPDYPSWPPVNLYPTWIIYDTTTDAPTTTTTTTTTSPINTKEQTK
jgi:hypothetical protein